MELENVAQESGWNFIFFDGMPISAESRVASLQSKFIKFLQFEKPLINWKYGESILYFDHKFEVKSEHVALLQDLCKTEILIRNTPKQKLRIHDEVNAALQQKRYAEVMPATIQWINEKIGKEIQEILNFNLEDIDSIKTNSPVNNIRYKAVLERLPTGFSVRGGVEKTREHKTDFLSVSASSQDILLSEKPIVDTVTVSNVSFGSVGGDGFFLIRDTEIVDRDDKKFIYLPDSPFKRPSP